MLRAVGLAAVALAASICGCGARQAPPSADGARLFATDCAACHTLRGDESARKPGGDLLGYHFSSEVWLEYAREMPVRRRLREPELEAIVDYVRGVQRLRGKG